MRRSKINMLAAAFALLVLVTITVFAKSAVWKVSKGDDPFHLAGTFHVLSADNHP